MKDNFNLNFTNWVDDHYENFIKSEKNLLKLLLVAVIICLLVSLFGLYSYISLITHKRRKEIAVRKINGATVKDIIMIFLKEYALILIVGGVIGFSISYILSYYWLRNYSVRIDPSIMMYLGLMLIFSIAMLSAVWFSIYKASIQNPAEVIKDE